jgi:hypothetical protein
VEAGHEGDEGIAAVAVLLGLQGSEPASLLLIEAPHQEVDVAVDFAAGVIVSRNASRAPALVNRAVDHDRILRMMSSRSKGHYTKDLEIIDK